VSAPDGPEIPSSAAYRVSLPEFEGPLDLLLHLCKTHEIDIVQLPVAFITEKYLEYLEMMQSLSVEVAAEYLVMAATLAYLKSRELVPTPDPLEAGEEGQGEDALDPREELIRRLLEYQKYKDAAEKLSSRPIEGRNVFVRGAALEAEGDAGLAEHSVWKLIEAWARTLEKAAPKHRHEVVIDRVSISDRINQLIDMLEADGSFRFDRVIDMGLPEVELRHQVVVTLLAVLELARLKVIRVLQDGASGEFFISPRDGAALEQARHVEITSSSESEGDQNAAADDKVTDEASDGATEEAPGRGDG
jgi:segregation and condensation protein A